MGAIFSALLAFLFQASLFAWTARLYQSPGWTNSVPWLFADRLVYALVMPGLGVLLLFVLAPRLVPGLPVGTPRLPLFQPGSQSSAQRLVGLVWAIVGAMVFFGLIYILSELLQDRREPGGLAGEIRQSNRLGLFLLTTGILTPILEELYYRGILQEFLQRGLPRAKTTGEGPKVPFGAILLQSMCFGLVHAGNGPVPAVTLWGVGLGLGILYWRYGLASSILAHSFYNLAILLHFQG